jgi:hypothetical protein
MYEIDLNQGFRVLDVYRRMRTMLHVRGKLGGDFAESRATVVEASPDEAEICLRLFEEADGPNWLCKFSVGNSRFWLNETGWNPNGNKQVGWSELLTIRQSDGSEIRIGEEILAAPSRAN